MLESLFQQITGLKPDTKTELSASGSNRRYFRLTAEGYSLIGVEGTSIEENAAFMAMSAHFAAKALPVPRVLVRSHDGRFYLQEDLGNTLLFDFIAEGRKTGVFHETEKEMLRETMRLLPLIQVNGARDFDFSVCYPQPAFNERSVFWDLNYFKYNFLKASGIDFQEDRLEDDFQRLAAILLRSQTDTFMYRDFQSRNVMIHNDKPYFIDFQGGRKGPLHYDVASFLWQAKAKYSEELRDELLTVYLESLAEVMEGVKNTTDIAPSSLGNLALVARPENFREQLRHFVLFRTLQVLGAYGFRGYFEKKPHFLQSIPYAMENLRVILRDELPGYPYLVKVLREMCELKQYREVAVRKPLIVKVYSFSYKKGIPHDDSGNGGGFVFDCRAVNNPGKYERYAHFTGLDESVIQFLEEDGEILSLLDQAYAMVDASVKRYKDRGFTNLMVSFGCTGGQHRSVYSAQKMAEHINREFGVEVHLIHREQNKEEVFGAIHRQKETE
ncbi:MAG: phosphotransferase [Paludibacter sp. 47-17]|nr:MAG: phosphotransferase [Paludibacter sp. SCN 50-10]OJX90628.1 MAG: phosphotransferase [Paludibacter sp. 47-17]